MGPRRSTKARTAAATRSRERGQQYRKRLKQYQKQLQRDVTGLRHLVRDLQLLSTLQQRLDASPQATATAVVASVRDVMGPESPSSQLLRFYVDAFDVVASGDAPVVALRGVLRGRLAAETVRRLYVCVPGNSALLDALLDRDVAFASTKTLFFGVDGSVLRVEDETDYTSTLKRVVPNPRGLCEVLSELMRSKDKPDAGRKPEQAGIRAPAADAKVPVGLYR